MVARPVSAPSPGSELGEIGAGEPHVAVEAESVVAALEAHRAGHPPAGDRPVDLFERESNRGRTAGRRACS